MEKTVTEPELLSLLSDLPDHRHIIAVAGAPASGKSTLAESLVGALNAERSGRAAVLPMDGFHYDDLVLEARGHRARKGAPHTFDVNGLRHLLLRLKANDEHEVAIPVFDRSIEIARAGASILPQSAEIIIAEGNYLLLDADPWRSLHALFDVTVSIDVPEAILRERLTERWLSYQLSAEEIGSFGDQWKYSGESHLNKYMKHTRSSLEDHLNNLAIDFEVHEHPAVYTVVEAQRHCGGISGCHCKNLFLRTKKKQLWLVVLEDNTSIDLKQLASLVGVKAWSFASPERLMEYLGVEPGSVTPFALINDAAKVVNVAIESKILSAPSANFHPLVNTATLNITAAGFKQFLRSTGHHPVEIVCD